MVLIHTDDLVRGSGIKETSNFSLERSIDIVWAQNVVSCMRNRASIQR